MEQGNNSQKFYRHGVLEGNHVEERFGFDTANRSV